MKCRGGVEEGSRRCLASEHVDAPPAGAGEHRGGAVAGAGPRHGAGSVDRAPRQLLDVQQPERRHRRVARRACVLNVPRSGREDGLVQSLQSTA